MEQKQWKTEDRQPLPPQRQQRPPRLQCPRCESRDTKFCYYNNYSTAQPRHYCRNCKRFWTQGGNLRNIPEGGRRKKAKTDSSSMTMSPSSDKAPAAHSMDSQVQVPVFAGAVGINGAYHAYYYGAGNASALGGHQAGAMANNLSGHPEAMVLDLSLMQPLLDVHLQLAPQMPEPHLSLQRNLMNNGGAFVHGQPHAAYLSLQQVSAPQVVVSAFTPEPAMNGVAPASATTPSSVAANTEAANWDSCISEPSVSPSPPSPNPPSSSAFM